MCTCKVCAWIIVPRCARGPFCPLRPNLCTARWHVKSRTAHVVRRVETVVETAVRVGLLQLKCSIEELECIIA